MRDISCLEYVPEVEYSDGVVEQQLKDDLGPVEILPVNVKSAFDKFGKHGLYYKNFSLQEPYEPLSVEQRLLYLKEECSELENFIINYRRDKLDKQEIFPQQSYLSQLADIKKKVTETEKLFDGRSHIKGAISFEDIITELEKLQAIRIESDITEDKSCKLLNLMYQLRLDHSQPSLHNPDLNIVNLVQRLEKIEAFIGPCDAKSLSEYPVPYEASDLQSIVTKLREIVALTDPNVVSGIETRINLVLQLLQKVQDKEASLPDLQLKSQVQELHQMVQCYSYLQPKLFSLNQRMKEIERVTKRGSSLVSYLDTIENDLKETEIRVAAQTSALNELEKAFDENIHIFKQNCDIILKKLDRKT